MSDERKPPRTWPEGRLGGDDDGAIEIKIGLHTNGETVVMAFATPVRWFGFGPELAMQMAGRMIEHAIRANKNTGGPPLVLDVNGIKMAFHPE